MDSFAATLRQLVGDSALVMVGRIALIGGSFLVHALLVRNLDPDVFGVLSLAITIVTVAAGFAAFGMHQAAARFISVSNREIASDYVIVSVTIVLVSSSVVGLALYGLRGDLEALFKAPGIGGLIRLLVVLVLLQPLASVALGVIRGFERTRARVMFHDILPLLVCIPVAYVLISHGEVILGGILFYVLRRLLQGTLLTVDLLRWNGWSFDPSVPDIGRFLEVFSFSWPLAFESLVVVFLGSIDIMMLGLLASSDSVGFYRSIQPVSNTIIVFLDVLTFIYLPLASKYFERKDINGLDRLYKASTRWVSMVTFPLVLFYILFGQAFIRILFQEAYVVAWSALTILAVGMYSRVLVGPNGMTIKAIDRTAEDLLALVGALMTNLILNYLLIPPLGIEGAAAATTTGYLVYNVIEIMLIYRYVGVSPFQWDLFLPLAPTAVGAYALAIMVDQGELTFVGIVIVGLGLSGLHLLSVLLTTGLNEDDHMILDAIRESRL